MNDFAKGLTRLPALLLVLSIAAQTAGPATAQSPNVGDSGRSNTATVAAYGSATSPPLTGTRRL